jgi:hypothetical protein
MFSSFNSTAMVVHRLVHDLESVDVLDAALGRGLEKRTRRTQERRFNIGSGKDEKEKQRDQAGKHAEVKLHAGRETLFFAVLDVVERSEANQPARPVDFLHHRVAGVDAGGTIDAFHLRAVADVDAGRAHHHALAAGDAIAEAGGGALVVSLIAMERAALFAPPVVVSDNHRVFVEHRALQAAVGTDEGAGLLAESARRWRRKAA